MGYGNLAGFIDVEGPNELTLRWHLLSNCYPPIHEDFMPAIKQAIISCNDGAPYDELELPNKVVLTAAEIVRQLHLEPFLQQEEE